SDKRQALRMMLDRKTLAAERRLVKPPAIWGERCATDGLSPRCDSLSVAIVKYILQRCRAKAKAEAHFFQMARNCLTKGMVAREVLLVVMQMQAPEQTRSVNTACRLLAAAADQRPTVTAGVLSVPNLTTGFSELTLRSQQTLHEKAWLRYKAAAHLWAAYNLMCNLLLQPGA